MKDFFISYTKADRQWAEWIAWQLEEAGHSVFLQAWDFRPAGNFVADIQRGATTAKRTIAVLSPDYFAAKFTQPEWQAAFARDPTGEKGILLPVRVVECDPPGVLGQIIYIDLVDKGANAARDILLAGVERRRAKPLEEPPFPKPGTRVVAEQPDFPGQLPSIWNVPRRNPNFTGRAELLDDLRKALTSGKPAALTQAIHGLGGIGKTQLAREYAYRHASDYRLVWWIQSEEPAKLASGFAGLARELDLSEKDAQDQRIIIEAVCRWLNQTSGWLLVFDNVPHPDDVRKYLPANPAGHVIVTSRDRNWRDVASPLEVTKMARPDSVSFLLRRTGKDDSEAADNLADLLDDFPLLLEQAGSYIVERGLSFAEYVGRFEQRQGKMLELGHGSQEYTETTASVWRVSFDAVQEESEAAAQLLFLCAFLAPDDIPCEMIADGAKHLPEPLAAAVKDPLAFDDVVAALHHYSLIDKGDGALSVHRLVQAVTRDRLPETEVTKWLRAGLEIVNAAFPGESHDVRFWPRCARLLPHTTSLTDHPLAPKVAPGAADRLLNQVGGYLWGRAEFEAAKTTYERALAIDEKAYGPDHPEVAIRVSNLGSVLQALGDLSGAKAHYERALAIGEKVYGPDHPDVAIDVNNLGYVLKAQGDLSGAKAHCERALAIFRKFLGDEHPDTVTVRRNLESLGSKT